MTSMAETRYEVELAQLGKTYINAIGMDISSLKVAVTGASGASIIGVGSGGSFTVASLLCNLHESYTGRVSRPSTPLELICNPTLASSSPVFLISAEGKNPDIIEALQRARRHSSRAVHLLTNRASSPIMDVAAALTDVTSHVFPLTEKDGYLATNSLLLDAVLIARAYGELDLATKPLPPTIDEFFIGEKNIPQWLAESAHFASEAVTRRSIIVVYAPLLRPIAADLESKLSEAALLYCQFVDIRSFAHGRHLWLAERPEDCAILALTETSLSALWQGMRALIPSNVPTCEMALGGATPQDLLAGLIAQMGFVSLVASAMGKDPAKPDVPEFGRQLYYLDLPSFIPKLEDPSAPGQQSKLEVLGAHWPSTQRSGILNRSLDDFIADFREKEFRSIVFDYDGTLCNSHRNDTKPPHAILQQITKLAENGISVGIASGRGGSIKEYLEEFLPSTAWAKIYLGLYNGGWMGRVGASIPEQGATSEFLSHVRRIVVRLKSLGVPIERIRETYPFQVSIRFDEGVQAEQMWFVIADALRQSGLDPSTVVRSKHSVDVLARGVNKSHLIAYIVQHDNIDPYEVITMGDQGAWPGNDYSLLEHRYSLSVDQPSRRLDRGWKLAPDSKRDVDATLWYLERLKITDRQTFYFDF
jgi:HAD superfamily hydrolase (TIGR01484 family)